MSALLEVSHVSKRFVTGGRLSRESCRCRRGRQPFAVVRRLRDLHDHRRVRFGQDDAGAHDPGPRASDERRHPVRGQEQRGTPNAAPPGETSSARAADLPEPVRDVQSAQAGRPLPARVGRAPSSASRTTAAAESAMDDALHKVGLSLKEVAGRYAHELSGGQLQRVAIARRADSQPIAAHRRRAGVDGRRIAANVDRHPAAGSAGRVRASRSSTSRTIWPRPTTSPTGSSSCRRDMSWRWVRRGRFSMRRSIRIPDSSRTSVLSINDAGTDALVPADRSEAMAAWERAGTGTLQEREDGRFVRRLSAGQVTVAPA